MAFSGSTALGSNPAQLCFKFGMHNFALPSLAAAILGMLLSVRCLGGSAVWIHLRRSICKENKSRLSLLDPSLRCACLTCACHICLVFQVSWLGGTSRRKVKAYPCAAILCSMALCQGCADCRRGALRLYSESEQTCCCKPKPEAWHFG